MHVYGTVDRVHHASENVPSSCIMRGGVVHLADRFGR
jgi:hypothetical protein